ncbi:MAG: hypothetical protein AAGA48_15655 [Myxococcota bacterium]
MRVWLVTILCSVACSGSSDDSGETGNDTGNTPEDTGNAPEETGMPNMPGEPAVLNRSGELTLVKGQWTGTERLVLENDDFLNPETFCIISWTVTGTEPRFDCQDCNDSPEGDGGAHSFVTSAAKIETESQKGACDVVLGAKTVLADSLEDLNGRTLHYGWGEEATGHGYSLFTLNDQGTWFDLTLVRNPFEDDGTFEKQGIEARLAYFVFEGSYEL